MSWIGETIETFAINKPDAPALTFGCQRLSWSNLHKNVEHAALYFDYYMPKNGSIGVYLPNSPLLILVVLASARSERVSIVYDWGWPKHIKKKVTGEVNPDILISVDNHDNPDILVSNYNLFKLDIFDLPFCSNRSLVSYPIASKRFYAGFTSGSSGLPKGFVRSQNSWLESFKAVSREVDFNGINRVMALGDLTHSITLYAALESICAGREFLFFKSFNPKLIIKTIMKEMPNMIYATPTQLMMLAKWSRGNFKLIFKSVKIIMTGGSKLPSEEITSLSLLFPSARIIEFYGASETSYVSIALPAESPPNGSVGRSFKDVSVSIRDKSNNPVKTREIGKIWVKSKMLFDCYLCGENKEFQRAEDWVTVGDYGMLDENGFLYLKGRADRMFLISGNIVYADEVELFLNGNPLSENEYFIENGKVVLKKRVGSPGTYDLTGTLSKKNADTQELVSIPVNQKIVVIREPNSAVVSADNMRVFYRGLRNPTSISIPGVASNTIVPSSANAKFSKTGSGWAAQPTNSKAAEMKINVSGVLNGVRKNFDGGTFRILPPPPGKGSITGLGQVVSNAEQIQKDLLLNGRVKGAKPKDFFYDYEIIVNGFDIKVGNLPQKTVSGSKVSANASAASDVRSASRGTVVVISNIKASSKDGDVVTPNYAVDPFILITR